MLEIQRILFPTDFSAHAERAFAHAGYMAARYEAEVQVLNVTAPHESNEQDPTEHLPLKRRDEERIEQLYVNADERAQAPVHYRQVEHATPAMAILEEATEMDADLIVMGTRGQSGGAVVGRVMERSVTEEVVRLAGCPTLTVRTGEGPAPPKVVRRLLAPVDFSDYARVQVAHAAALADAYGAELDLLHVIDEGSLEVIYGPGLGSAQRAEMRERTENALRRLAEEAGLPEPASQVHVVDGHPAAAILDFAETHETRLIVMATHGRTGLERFLIGSVAEKVVRTASCPVFTVRSFGKSLVHPDAALAEEPFAEGA